MMGLAATQCIQQAICGGGHARAGEKDQPLSDSLTFSLLLPRNVYLLVRCVCATRITNREVLLASRRLK